MTVCLCEALYAKVNKIFTLITWDKNIHLHIMLAVSTAKEEIVELNFHKNHHKFISLNEHIS